MVVFCYMFSPVQVVFSRDAQTQDWGRGSWLPRYFRCGRTGQDLSVCLTHQRNAGLCKCSLNLCINYSCTCGLVFSLMLCVDSDLPN